MKQVMFFAALAACALLFSSGRAMAEQRKPGDRLVYTLHVAGQARGSAQNLDSKITVSIDRVDTDGTAHANVTTESPQMAQMNQVPFDATFSAAGEILTKVDTASLSPKEMAAHGMSEKEEKKLAAIMGAEMVQVNLRAFNAFAAACGGRTLQIGDTWHAPPEGLAMEDISYKVIGREQHLGHDSYVISLNTVPNASTLVSGLGYYDASAHLVIGLHSEQKSSQATETIDTSLVP